MLITLPDEAFEALVRELAALPPKLPFSSAVTEAVERAVGDQGDDVKNSAANSLLWVYSTRVDRKVPLGVFAGEISRALEGRGVRSDEREKSRVKGLIDIESIYLGYNMEALLGERERILFSSRLVTDLRPVFPSKSESAPAAFLPVHTLRLRYSEQPEGNVRDFFVSLDMQDIDDLIAVLNRAKQKAVQLRGISDATKLEWLEPPME